MVMHSHAWPSYRRCSYTSVHFFLTLCHLYGAQAFPFPAHGLGTALFGLELSLCVVNQGIIGKFCGMELLYLMTGEILCLELKWLTRLTLSAVLTENATLY